MDTIFDLPSHPLFSHFPIVLAPLIVLAAGVLAVRPAWRAALGPVVAGASVVTLVALFLARRSGEELFELLEREPSIDRHEELANQSVVLWVLFVALTTAMVVLHRRSERSERTTPAVGEQGGTGAVRARRIVDVLAVLCVLIGVVSTVWIARTGHEGAKSHWSFVSED